MIPTEYKLVDFTAFNGYFTIAIEVAGCLYFIGFQVNYIFV